MEAAISKKKDGFLLILRINCQAWVGNIFYQTITCNRTL